MCILNMPLLAMLRRYNKQVLKVFPYPFTCTALQVGWLKPSD